jgi:AraC-like DNA-binding protein
MAEGMSVTEAAFECGFESLSYFSRTYKKIMGVSPSKNKSSGTF